MQILTPNPELGLKGLTEGCGQLLALLCNALNVLKCPRYKYKLDKPVRIDDFLRLHHFKKIYSAKYNIKSPNNFEEELIVYNYREKIYIRWTDIIKHDSEDQRFQLYEKWKQKNIEKIQYMGELCLFFLDLFMSGKVYYNLGEILDDIEPNKAKELFHFLVERDNTFNK